MKQEHEETMSAKEENDPPIISVNRNFKDTLFRKLFQEKEALLELYNAMNHTTYTDTKDLEIITLDNTIYMNMKNDLAFLINFQLHMYEHQSTVNPNMPLRFLQYVSKEYEKLVDRNATYRSKQIKLPSPHFVVFYNGSKEQPEQLELRLSNAYEVEDIEPNLELKVLVLNINHGNNQQLMEQCKTLKQYMQYVECVRKHSEQFEIELAVEYAITECIREGVLSDFLQKNRLEAKSMSIFEYHEEEVLKLIRMDEREEAMKEAKIAVMKEVKIEAMKEAKIEAMKEAKIEAMKEAKIEAMKEAKIEAMKEALVIVREEVQKEAILKLVKIVSKMYSKGKSVSKIAEDLYEDVDYIQSICEVTKLSAPNYDIEWICAKVMEQHT